MDEAEFRRLLLLFPVVRSRDYHASVSGEVRHGSLSAFLLDSKATAVESEISRESTSKPAESELKEWQDAWEDGEKKDMEKEHDAFWEKLKSLAERKVDATEAERFCKAFQRVHKKLVYEELSLDAAKTFLNSS